MGIEDDMWFIPCPEPGQLSRIYDELTRICNIQEERRIKAMSEETKKTIEEAGEFFKKVKEGAEKYQGIPDKKLTEKIKKIGEGAGEVVKHIEEHKDHK
jgi:hypothetical protein